MVSDQKELQKSTDYAADTNFADYSGWRLARGVYTSGGAEGTGFDRSRHNH